MMPDRVDWNELGPEFIAQWGWPNGKWDPEHLAALGPTGSGKTQFVTTVVDMRCTMTGAHAVILATKPADGTLNRLKSKGWALRRTWPPDYGETKVLYWPPGASMQSGNEKQRRAIFDFLAEQWKPDANVIIVFDEIAYVETELRLKRQIEQYWREARTMGITICAMTQRPRNVSRQMHAMPAWFVGFRPDDEDDAKRVAEIAGSRRLYTPILMELDPYEFVLIKRRTREAYISSLPDR